jgi:hypothetical protein
VSIKKALSRIGIALSVVATVAIGQTNPSGSVKIGNLTWTKQNVNIKTPDSWCYEGKDSKLQAAVKKKDKNLSDPPGGGFPNTHADVER